MRSFKKSINIHHIVLIHGIAGKKDDFGHMIAALMTQLNHRDPDTKYLVHQWEYLTRDDQLTTFDFATDLTNFVANLSLNKQDKLSFITHSQGAIILLLWLASNKEHKVINHLDFAINLAPPFWGAKIAEFGVAVKKVWEFAGITPLPFGSKQLQELSYGSDTIEKLRDLIIHDKSLAKLANKQIRFLTIAGKAQVMNIFAPFTAGKNQFEDDSAVPISSTRLGFYYIKSQQDSQLTSQKMVEYGEYRVVNALHLSPSPNKFPGIAQITKQCIYDQQNEHPSFNLIVDHILGISLPQPCNDLSKCSSFLISISITGCQKKSQIEFFELNHHDLQREQISFSNPFEPYSKGEILAKNEYRYYCTGTLLDLPAEPIKQKNIAIKISPTNHKAIWIEATVKATYSTYIDLDLSPKPL